MEAGTAESLLQDDVPVRSPLHGTYQREATPRLLVERESLDRVDPRIRSATPRDLALQGKNHLDPRGRERRALLRRHVHRLRPLKVIQGQDAAYRAQRLGEGHGQDDVLPRRCVRGDFGREP